MRGLLLLTTALLVLAVVSVCVGTRTITPTETLAALTAFDPTDSKHLLVRHLRVPRTAVAIVVGAALAVAGVIMQALTRNPLADPGILGVNAGAALAVAAAISILGVTTPIGYLWFGLLGASVAGAAVYLLGGQRKGTDPVRVVLAGTALSVVLLSLTQVLLVNSDEKTYEAYRLWMVGSLQGRGTDVLYPSLALVVLGLVIAWSLAGVLDVASLGEDLGRSLGAHLARTWSLAALAVIMLAGAATAAAGPIAFVGLVAPHIARFVASNDHRWLLPYAVVLGALLVLGADCLGRVIARPGELAAGITVALAGGPFFIALVRRRRVVQL